MFGTAGSRSGRKRPSISADTGPNAYANAILFANTVANAAYANAIATSSADATSKAATAYSNATAYSDTIAGTAYANAILFANTVANNAYTNAVATAATDASTKAATAYSNAILFANTVANNAYTNATAYSDTIAGTAYANAIAFAANGTNITSGTIADARLSANYNTGVALSANNSAYLGGLAASGYANTSTPIIAGPLTVGNSTVNSIINSTSITTTLLIGSQINTAANLALTSANVYMSSAILTTRDLIVSGNVTIQGTLATIDATNLQVTDPLIKLSRDQTTSDILSIGLYGTYGNSTVTQFSGLFRDHSNSAVWTLFNTQLEPTTTVDTSNNTYTVGTLFAKLHSYGLISNATNVSITSNSTLSVNITANNLTATNTLTSYALISNATNLNLTANSTLAVAITSNTENISDTLSVGNSTVNSVVNTTTVSLGVNSTATAFFVAANGNIGIATVAPTSNLHINGTVQIGNSTVNVIANSTAIQLSNSTSNTMLTVPSAANWAATNVFLHANGSWVTVASGSPGGSNTHVQFNDSTAFGGSAGLIFDKTTNNFTVANTVLVGANVFVDTVKLSIGNTIANAIANSITMKLANSTGSISQNPTNIQLTEIGTSSVPTPEANSTAIFNVTLAGTQRPAFRSVTDLTTIPFQRQFGTSIEHRCKFDTYENISDMAAGAYLSPIATTNIMTATPRWVYDTVTTNNSPTGYTSPETKFWKGNATGAGGFFIVTTFGFHSNVNHGFFIGLTSNSTAPANGLMSTTRANAIGVGWDTADANISFIEKTGTGAATKTSIGAKVPSSIATLYLYCPPNGGPIKGTLVEHKTFSTTVVTHRTFSTSPPANTTLLYFQACINNNTQNAARTFYMCNYYAETFLGPGSF